MTLTWYEILSLLAVPSVVAFILHLVYTFIANKIKTNKSDDTAIRKGLQALLRNQLIQAHDHYIKLGYIEVNDKANFSNMYTCYHNLGKNGVMDVIYKEVMELPTTKIIEKQEESK